MNNGQPKLRTRPPSGDQASTLARLERLNDWTEEPARAVAASIGAAPREAAPEAPEAAPGPAKPARKTSGDHPWSDKPSDHYVQMNVRIPADLYAKLRWLGSTTYDSSMTKIVTDSLQKTAKKMLGERNIQ